MIDYLALLKEICEKILIFLPTVTDQRRRHVEEIANYCEAISQALDNVAQASSRGEIAHKDCALLRKHRDGASMLDAHSIRRPLGRLTFVLPKEVTDELRGVLDSAIEAEYFDATPERVLEASATFLAVAQQLRAGQMRR